MIDILQTPDNITTTDTTNGNKAIERNPIQNLIMVDNSSSYQNPIKKRA